MTWQPNAMIILIMLNILIRATAPDCFVWEVLQESRYKPRYKQLDVARDTEYIHIHPR